MTSTPRRATCPHCLRPLSACICALAQPVACATQVLILQHPLEVHEAKGTARLLHLCLPGSRLEVGEQFDAAQLQQWLHAPWQPNDAPRQPVLLYPPSPDLPAPPALPEPLPASAVRLVVIDGTWRKSRKMLYANPALQTLPRLGLAASLPSEYRIRKAQRAGQLSTLEACTHALAGLENWAADGAEPQALLNSFDSLLNQLTAQRNQQQPSNGQP